MTNNPHMDDLERTKIKKQAGPADHLANERTFLSWIRTSIALMGFGFVIVKFALFLQQISFVLGEGVVTEGRKSSAVVGVVMVALGAILATLAYFRYSSIASHLNNNTYYPSKWLSTLLTLSIIIGALLLVFYLLPNI